jgi:hypothetical protein
MRVGSRLAIGPSALRPKLSRKSLLRRRSVSAGTVVREKTIERRAFRCAVLLCAKTRWFPTSPSARAIRTATPDAGATGSSVPSGGAVRKVPGVHRSSRRRSASDPGLAVGTDLAAVRVGTSRIAGRIRRRS